MPYPYLKAMRTSNASAFRRPIRRASALAAVVLLTAATCHEGCYDEPLPDPTGDLTVKEIEVVPGLIAAVPDKPFRLSVRLRNAAGQLLPESAAGTVQWSVSLADAANVSLTGVLGSNTVATVTPAALAAIVVTAQKGSVAGTATLTPVTAIAAGKLDWVVADAVANGPPTLLLLDGRIPAEWRSDSLIAFAGAGPLDELGTSSGEITVFSQTRAVSRIHPPWAGEQCDYVGFTASDAPLGCSDRGPFTLPPATIIAVNVWILANGASIAAVADADFAHAKSLLFEAFTGLTLQMTRNIGVSTSLVLDVGADNEWVCPASGPYDIRQQLVDAGVPAASLASSRLNVVYVNHILKPAERGSGNWAYPGYTCSWTPRDGAIVIMSASKRKHTTLVHEFGHALGPWDQDPWGHVSGMPGFDESNVMWAGESNLVPSSRTQLTLGQAFRLSLDAESFVVRAAVLGTPPPVFNCFSIETDNPCPRLSKDISKR